MPSHKVEDARAHREAFAQAEADRPKPKAERHEHIAAQLRRKKFSELSAHEKDLLLEYLALAGHLVVPEDA